MLSQHSFRNEFILSDTYSPDRNELDNSQLPIPLIYFHDFQRMKMKRHQIRIT